jgi:hypothetical protein
LKSGFWLLQTFIYAHPEGLMRDLLREAALQSKLACYLVRKVPSASIKHAVDDLELLSAAQSPEQDLRLRL